MHKFWLASIREILLVYQWPFAQHMLSKCQQSHKSCRVGREGVAPYIPRRLISIGLDPTDLRLIETDECDEQPAKFSTYAALSYCWGTSGKNYKTTPQNITDNKTRLPLENLPDVSSLDRYRFHVVLKQNSYLDTH